jgi:hypothetical protein
VICIFSLKKSLYNTMIDIIVNAFSCVNKYLYIYLIYTTYIKAYIMYYLTIFSGIYSYYLSIIHFRRLIYYVLLKLFKLVSYFGSMFSIHIIHFVFFCYFIIHIYNLCVLRKIMTKRAITTFSTSNPVVP